MIKVGVNENLVLSRAEKNDKGTLVIAVREVGTEVKEKKVQSAADMMSDGSDATGSSGGEQQFLMFQPGVTKYDDPTQPEDGKKIMGSFIDLKNQLAHWLKRFVPESQIKFSPFSGVQINAADENAIFSALQTLAITEKVYANYVDQFLAQIKPHLNNEAKPGRLFLHRKSEASHFGVLRKKFLDNQPFWESMDIPVTSSKLYTKQVAGTTVHHEPVEIDGIKYVPNFSPYELKNKLDSTEVIASTADASTTTESELEAVGSLFTAGADTDAAGPTGFVIEED